MEVRTDEERGGTKRGGGRDRSVQCRHQVSREDLVEDRIRRQEPLRGPGFWMRLGLRPVGRLAQGLCCSLWG